MNIDWKTAPSFIEVQFPVSKLSKECYKERRSNDGQTITGLGKWWGRKPLTLVRSCLLGLLLPATNDPVKDRAVFLALMAMDDAGLKRRFTKTIPPDVIWAKLAPTERIRHFGQGANEGSRLLRLTRAERESLFATVFSRLSDDEKLEYCELPENASPPDSTVWTFLNDHLGTKAESIDELVLQLGELRFGRRPRVGDSFCGGGSIPFEATRAGCDSFATDLNPVAALLTWASTNILAGGESRRSRAIELQEAFFAEVDRRVRAFGVEANEAGWRADAFLYVVEATCPECGWRVPMFPHLVVGQKSSAVARLVPVNASRTYEIEIMTGVDAAAMATARATTCCSDSRLVCPNCSQTTPLAMLRGDRRGGEPTKLRAWGPDDVEPQAGDTFGERLYCIRWTEEYEDEHGETRLRKLFRAVAPEDEERERTVVGLLHERLDGWRSRGILPNRRIEPGEKTDEPIRTRGWRYWHHLFTPRQLLLLGVMGEVAEVQAASPADWAQLLLTIGRAADWSSRLCRWGTGAARESIAQTFSNQALNTLYTYAGKALPLLQGNMCISWDPAASSGSSSVAVCDARSVADDCDIWITDPPYADSVNYHELSEYFLAWYGGRLGHVIPDAPSDSRRALAISGEGQTFRKSMAECYRNLTNHMPDNGFQVVMFTHQDAGVWADLTLTLWAAGLSVTSAWCIATERDSAMREGNYVQGTVLLVLRKQTSDDTAFLDEIHPLVEDEVRSQLASMLALEDKEDPNFGDADYQLAAYAAALRVLTRYRGIEDINVEDQLTRVRQAGERNPVEELIADAVRTACDFLIPKGFNGDLWKQLGPEERLYLKAVEVETHGEHRSGVYQELARGFRVKDYKGLIESSKANHTRIKTATEFGARELGTVGFGTSVMRAVLFAVRETVRASDPQVGKNYLREGLTDYWTKRVLVIALLDYLSNLGVTLEHWGADAEAARLLAGAVRNDSV